VAKAVEGYGVKIDIRNEICAELNWAGHNVQSHGTVQTPCRDIPLGEEEACLFKGSWNVGVEGMISYEIGYNTGKANYSNNTETNSTNLGSLEAIGAFIGTVAAGASVAKAVEGYGVKIDIRNEICAELNWAGHNVQSHGTVQTPCRDIPLGEEEACLFKGSWNVGVEGMISYEIGYNTGKAIIIYYRASAGWGQKNRLNVFFANSVSSDNELYERYWKHVYVADTDATGHWEWQYHGTYYNSDDTRVVRYSALNLELEATIGGGNNPVLVVDVQAIDKSSFSTCHH